MRTPALLGALLLQTMLAPTSPLAGQSLAHVSGGLSFGVFDGMRVGLSASFVSWNTPHGIHSDDWGRRSGAYSRGYGSWGGYGGRGDPADYCWDRAWQLRRDHSYFGWYGPARYDHLDFYLDCLRFGTGYAYDRWRWRAHSAARFHRSWVHVSVLVLDPFRRPWGPSWAYDPWGWYWDGWRYGPGWHGPWGGIEYAGVVWSTPRVGTVYAPRGTVLVARPSPLVTPRFKEDPRGVAPNPAGARRAVPRGERVAAPPTRAGQSGARPALADAPRPSDRSRRPLSPALAGAGGRARPAPAAQATRGRGEAESTWPSSAAPRRPSDRARGAAAVRAPSVRGGAPSARRGERATARPSSPARPSAGRSRPAAPAVRPRTERSGPTAPPAARPRAERSGPAAPPAARPRTGRPRPAGPPAAAVRGGGARPAPAASRGGGAERPPAASRGGAPTHPRGVRVNAEGALPRGRGARPRATARASPGAPCAPPPPPPRAWPAESLPP